MHLPFGVATDPAVYLPINHGVLLAIQGLPIVCVYIDDILVPGIHNLNEVVHATPGISRPSSKKDKFILSSRSVATSYL